MAIPTTGTPIRAEAGYTEWSAWMPAVPNLSRAHVALIGATTVVVFDAVSATASRLLGFPYGRGVIGSFVIYAATGYFVAKAGSGAASARLRSRGRFSA